MKKAPPADHPIRELCALCRSGKLFAVMEWCNSGKPVHLPNVHHSYSPMWIAIDQNFHSLVEVLLDYGAPADADALWYAVRKKRVDLVKLFFDRGANAKSIHFLSLIYSGDQEIVKMFVDRGADILTGYPIAEALTRSVREWVGLCKGLLPARPELMFQINMAMRHFCYEGRLQGVCLMLWLGGDPRAKVPLRPKDPELGWETSLAEALLWGHVEIVDKIGVDPEKDDMREALRTACISTNRTVVKKLLKLGADMNAVDATGRTVYDTIFFMRGSEAGLCLGELINTGYIWKPQIEDEIEMFRKFLLNLSLMQAYAFVKNAQEHGWCAEDIWIAVFNNPKIKRHFWDRREALGKILPSLKRVMVDETLRSSGKKSKPDSVRGRRRVRMKRSRPNKEGS